MRFLIQLLAFSFFLFSCKNDKAPITEKKMSEIILDLHIANAYLKHQDRLLEDTPIHWEKDSNQLYYIAVLQNYKIKKTDFQKAIYWYKKHPDKFALVYEDVLKNLAKLKEKNKASKSPSPAKPIF